MDTEDKSIDNASNMFIYVHALIDTDRIRSKYSALSQDKNNPTWINDASLIQLTVSECRGVISGQGTANLKFKANVNDLVAFTGMSVYANSDDAAIIYKIEHVSGDQVFNPFRQNIFVRKEAVIPDVNSADGLPAKYKEVTFSQFSSSVSKSGSENFTINFAIYKLDAMGQRQVLVGYGRLDPTIVVN